MPLVKTFYVCMSSISLLLGAKSLILIRLYYPFIPLIIILLVNRFYFLSSCIVIHIFVVYMLFLFVCVVYNIEVRDYKNNLL